MKISTSNLLPKISDMKILFVYSFVLCMPNPMSKSNILERFLYTGEVSNPWHIQHIYKLTHISLASFLWDIGKQNSPRCDAAKCGIPSVSWIIHDYYLSLYVISPLFIELVFFPNYF